MKFPGLALLLFMHAYASDCSSKCFNSNEATTVNNDFSNLTSFGDIQQQTAVAIKALLSSTNGVSNRAPCCNLCVYKEILAAKAFARKTQKYLPLGSEYIQKLQNSHKSLRESVMEMNNLLADNSNKYRPTDCSEKGSGKPMFYDTYAPRRVQAVVNILEALQSVSLTQSSFKWLIKFSTFVIEFATEFELLGENNLHDFNIAKHALIKRKEELDMLASETDWKNIDRYYDSYSQSLFELLGKIDFSPKVINSKELSRAVHVLANAVNVYAEFSSNNEDIRLQIKAILDQEEETSRLYRTYKSMNNIHEGSSEERSSEEDSNS